MLKELEVENFAIMKKLAFEPKKGLNILTGETGTGKSIIIGALGFILGEKTSADSIRSGSKRAVVEGVFEIDHIVAGLIEAAGVEVEDRTVILKRVISTDGKTKCYANGSPVTLSFIKKIGDELLDMHGQHEHQSLLKVAKHLDLLDGFANCAPLRTKFSTLYKRYHQLKEELDKKKQEMHLLKEKAELYDFQIKEIERAKLVEGEDAELLKEQNILENYEALYNNMHLVYNLLYEDENSILNKLSIITKNLEEVAKIDETQQSKLESSRSLLYETEDLSREVCKYTDGIEFDPKRLEEVHERLAMIEGLKKKYGGTISEILKYGAELGSKINTLEGSDEEILKIVRELKSMRTDLGNLAKDLSEARKDAASHLEKQVLEELKELGMESARFKIEMESEPDEEGLVEIFGQKYRTKPTGIDTVEFLISPNIGEDLRPLRKIASGGEISRIMLSLKSILTDIDRIPILVFDEIDMGIGSKTAEAVGEKLKKIAEKRQVICITHLPQIAAFGSTHYQVKKTSRGGRTYTELKRLTKKERTEEIARMLGGKKVTESTIETAKEMLKKEK